MALAHVPSAATSLPTSAALSVLYFKQAPETGSYVLSVRNALACEGCGGSAETEEPASLKSDGGDTVYLLVVRVWVSSVEIGGVGARSGQGGITHSCGAGGKE